MAALLTQALKELEVIKASRIDLMARLEESIKNNSEYEASELKLSIAELDNKYLDLHIKTWGSALEATQALKNMSDELQLNVSHLKSNFLAYLKMMNINTGENIH